MIGRRTRTKLQFGHSAVNSSDVRELRNAWDTRRLVLVLGAGVSVPCGLPSWRKLILDLLYSHSATARRWRGLDPEARRALLVWLCDHLDQDPLVLARLAKRSISSRRRGAAGQTPTRSCMRFAIICIGLPPAGPLRARVLARSWTSSRSVPANGVSLRW